MTRIGLLGGAALLALALPAATHAAGEDPQQLVAQLESRLLNARRVVIEGTIRSSGAFATDLRGRTELSGGNQMEFAWSGGFAGQVHDLSLKANGRTLTVRNGARVHSEDVGAESNRAVLIGLVRMGLLHNLARMTGLNAPDHAGGGAETWVTLEAFRQTTYALGGDMDGAASLGFDVVVNGQTSAVARLWLDPDTGLPLRREQTVQFKQGEMKVVEDYDRFVLE